MTETTKKIESSPADERPSSLPEAQPTEESSPPEITPVKKVAGGVTAALTAAKYAFGEMGVGRGTRTLWQLNQKAGV
ncbi:MAG TPA: hypothetical protein VLQ90_15985, partial [Pyrinomonadaceae bacterium]|nr:hypothetical protein [Pyrinomonadaceae bacterium]